MTCKACGYDDSKKVTLPDRLFKKTDRPYFEVLHGVYKPPFFISWADGGATPECGTNIDCYACPKCGTVKMEV